MVFGCRLVDVIDYYEAVNVWGTVSKFQRHSLILVFLPSCEAWPTDNSSASHTHTYIHTHIPHIHTSHTPTHKHTPHKHAQTHTTYKCKYTWTYTPHTDTHNIHTYAYMHTIHTICIHIYAYTITYSRTDHTHAYTIKTHTHTAKHTYTHNTCMHVLTQKGVGMRMHNLKYRRSIHPVMKFPRYCESQGSKGANSPEKGICNTAIPNEYTMSRRKGVEVVAWRKGL